MSEDSRLHRKLLTLCLILTVQLLFICFSSSITVACSKLFAPTGIKESFFFQFLQRYLKHYEGIFTHIVAFIPTGWEMSWKKKTFDSVRKVSLGNITMYGVPYSEHSSFTELRRFVQFLKPIEIIPTVNATDPTKRSVMTKYFKQWLSEPSSSPCKRKTEGDQYVQQKITRYIKPQTEQCDL
jgi:hypothetical protein